MFSWLKRKHEPLIGRRLIAVAVAHGLQPQEIPRLFPAIGYGDVGDPHQLVNAITPAVIDSAAALFGVRREFLEGLDDMAYFPFGSGRIPARESMSLVVDAVALAVSAWSELPPLARGPLAVLTDDATPDRLSGRVQRLVPIIIEPSGNELDGPVYRCQVFGGYMDWRNDDQRLGLKAVAWLVWHRLRKIVPIYRVSESELDDVMSGMAVPSVVFRRSILTNPSLEDFVMTPTSSGVAKETEELPEILAFLESSGLAARWDAAFAPKPPETDAAAGPADIDPEPNETPPPAKPRGGKREASEEIKNGWRAVARGIWASQPTATIAAVVRRLKAMPDLKGNAMSESAIHRAISSVAPEGASKPGRRPKNSS